jgi:hypothetical protein
MGISEELLSLLAFLPIMSGKYPNTPAIMDLSSLEARMFGPGSTINAIGLAG